MAEEKLAQERQAAAAAQAQLAQVEQVRQLCVCTGFVAMEGSLQACSELQAAKYYEQALAVAEEELAQERQAAAAAQAQLAQSKSLCLQYMTSRLQSQRPDDSGTMPLAMDAGATQCFTGSRALAHPALCCLRHCVGRFLIRDHSNHTAMLTAARCRCHATSHWRQSARAPSALPRPLLMLRSVLCKQNR